MQNLISYVCKIAIGINIGIGCTGFYINESSLVFLSIINILLLSTHFIFKEEIKK
tara:strand:- start:79 stop:243 length:165 start_codon:yes stop_codon:yes gene_type:complete